MLICSIIADIILLMSIILFEKIIFKFCFNDNNIHKTKLLTLLACIIVLTIIVNIINNLYFTPVMYVILVCVLTYILFDEKIKTAIIASLWTVIIMELLDTMSVVFIEMLAKMIRQLNSPLMILTRSLFLLIFVIIIGKLYNKNYNKGIKSISIVSLITFTLLTIVDTFVVMLIGYIITTENELKHQKIYFVTLMLVIIGLFIQLGSVILLLIQRNIYKEAQQLTERYLEEQKTHYEYLEKREHETKKFRHDLKSHMEMLTDLINNQEYDKFDKYIDVVNCNIEKFSKMVTVQNSIVDAIINKYYWEAEGNNVDIVVTGRFPKKCDIDAYDLCTIFSNLMSNALEAAIVTEDRWIKVDCRYNKQNIIINAQNSFLNKGDNTAKTYKKDTNYHGFGLENIKDAIKKYNGICDIETNKNVYQITISLEYRSCNEE